MRFSTGLLILFASVNTSLGSPLFEDAIINIQKRDTPGFATGQPIDGNGKGGPILGASSGRKPSPNY